MNRDIVFDDIASIKKGAVKRFNLPYGDCLFVEHNFCGNEWGYNIELFNSDNELINSWGYYNLESLEIAWNSLKREIQSGGYRKQQKEKF